MIILSLPPNAAPSVRACGEDRDVWTFYVAWQRSLEQLQDESPLKSTAAWPDPPCCGPAQDEFMALLMCVLKDKDPVLVPRGPPAAEGGAVRRGHRSYLKRWLMPLLCPPRITDMAGMTVARL